MTSITKNNGPKRLLASIKEIDSIELNGEKGGVLDNVKVKATNDAYFEAHVDLDDANAHLIKTGDVGIILIGDESE